MAIVIVPFEVEQVIGGGDFSILKFSDVIGKSHTVVVVSNRKIDHLVKDPSFRVLKPFQIQYTFKGSTRINRIIFRVAFISIALVKRLCKREKLVFLGYLRRPAKYAVRLAESLGAKSIVLHFETPNWIEEYSKTCCSESGLWKGVENTYKKADYLISNSLLSRKYCEAWIGRKPDGVAYPGIEFCGERLQPVQKKDQILVLGRLVDSKEPELAIKVARSQDRPMKLVFIGSGPKKGDLYNFAEQVGQEILILEEVTEPSKWEILRESKLLFFGSKFEGFGMPPGEALLAGTACVARDLPVLKEVYNGFLDYFLTEEEAVQKVKALLEFDDYRKEWENRGLKFIKDRYSWEVGAKIIEKTASL